MPVWPVGTNDADRPAATAARRSSSATDILPTAQSVATVRITRLPGSMEPPDGRLHPLRRTAIVDEPDARRTGGVHELRVVAQERVEPGQDVQAGPDRGQDHRPPLVGQLAAGRGDADQQRIGPGQEPEGGIERVHDGDVVPARVPQPLADVAAGLGGIDDGDDPVRAEADDAHRGLAVVEAEVPLGEDHEAAVRCNRHQPIPEREEGGPPAESSATRRHGNAPGEPEACHDPVGTPPETPRREALRIGVGTAYRIRTGGLRLERAVSWASRRMRQEPDASVRRRWRITGPSQGPQPLTGPGHGPGSDRRRPAYRRFASRKARSVSATWR